MLENWIISRVPLLHDGKLGETIAQVEDLIRKHEDFEKTIEAQEDKFNALRRVTMVSLHRLLKFIQLHTFCFFVYPFHPPMGNW